MNILAIETATEACSVALSAGNEIIQRYQVAPREHTHLLLPMIESVLAEAGIAKNQLDALTFSRGPGAFTGVRIAASAAQGIAFGLDLPVMPVSTLAVIAYGAYRETGSDRVLAAIDARMQEVYWSGYQVGKGYAKEVIKESVIAPERVEIPQEGEWVGAGTGWAAYGDEFGRRLGNRLIECIPQALPDATDLLSLAIPEIEGGNTISAEQILPVYLRDNVAKKPKTG